MPQDATTIPWPAWMLRYAASGDEQQAFWDFVWSVGGSPPYGGVSYEEGAAVYELIEDYRGPGMASPHAYQAVMQHIQNDPYRVAVLKIFQCIDRVHSSSNTYTRHTVAEGIALNKQVNHEGVGAYFLALEADLSYRRGDVAAAKGYSLDALNHFLKLAEEDPVYGQRAAQMAQNTVSFTARSGDTAEAKRLQSILSPIIAHLNNPTYLDNPT